MSYAILGIRGLGGKATSSGVDKTLLPYAENADWFRIINHDENVKGAIEDLSAFNGRIVILCFSMGWIVRKYLSELKDVYLVSWDPAQNHIGFNIPLESNLGPDRHLNIWQKSYSPVDLIQQFGPVTNAKNERWPENGHSKLDDRLGVQKLTQEHIDAFLLEEMPVTELNRLEEITAALERALDPSSETPKRTAFYRAFFDSLRNNLYSQITPETVDGLKTLLWLWDTTDYFEQYPTEYLASILGNAYRETGGRMQPIRETNKPSDEAVVRVLDNWWASGEAQQFGVRSTYWRWNGKGYAFGRGIFQTTHDENYVKSDALILRELGIASNLANDYSQGLHPVVSAYSAFLGPIHGIYRTDRNTKKPIKLADYQGREFDFYNARDILNGDKRKVGREVERASKSFLQALQAGQRAASSSQVPDIKNPVETLPEPIVGSVDSDVEVILSEFDLLDERQAQFILAMRKYGAPPDYSIIEGGITAPNIQLNSPATERGFSYPEQGTETMAFSRTKSLFQSKTIWGLVAAGVSIFVPQLAPIVDIVTPEVAEVTPEAAEATKEAVQSIVTSVSNIVAAFSLLFSGYGRFAADSKIGNGG
ncbi:MAG: hypothetical protein AAF478_13195 [Pseudomonadota bacterium]